MADPGTAEKLNQDTSDVEEKSTATAKGLDGDGGGAEAKPERTYKQSEVDALLGKAGQKIQAKLDAVTKDRDSYKSQAEKLTSEIAEAQESVASLNKEIEAMSEDDPDKQALKTLRREKEAELKAAKAERAGIAETKAKIEKWERDQLVYSVAAEYVTATGEKVDLDSFKSAADKFKLNGREELEDLAETLGFKNEDDITKVPESPPVKPYSGQTEGGSESLEGLKPRELFQRAYSKKK